MENFILLATKLGQILKSKNLFLTTAESCTGGEVAQIITSVAGSSNWFERGFVTYSNQAKIDMLGVQLETLERYGAVSKETAIEMAQGALKHSQADVSLSVTGIAGPQGGTPLKPVGLVWFALSTKNQSQDYSQNFSGDRIAIRDQAAKFILEELLKYLDKL